MVRKGSFTVELIDATTNLPFKEHTKQEDASVYVEVEPDTQYWIQVQSDANDDDDTYNICELEVDGKDMGFEFYLQAGVSDNVGLTSLSNQIVTQRAFHVQTLKRDKEERNPFWIGTIKARFYHATKLLEQYWFEDFECDWGAGGEAPVACTKGEKSLSSTPGTITETWTTALSYRNRFHRGELLETITLHYCTTVGLIYVKILPQPPNWEFHRLLFPIENNPTPLDPILAAIQPTTKTVTLEIDGKIQKVVSVEIFDLYHLDDSVDNNYDKKQVATSNHAQQQAITHSNKPAPAASTVTDDSSIGSPDASPQKHHQQQQQQVVDSKKDTPHCHPNKNWHKYSRVIDQDESCSNNNREDDGSQHCEENQDSLDTFSRPRKRLLQHCDSNSDGDDNNKDSPSSYDRDSSSS